MLTFDRSQIEVSELYQSGQVRRGIQDIVGFLGKGTRERDQTRLPSEKIRFPRELREALFQAGKGRCAFCEESHDDLQVHAFRPTGRVLSAHSREEREFYFWLMLTWRNLFPICPSCQPKEESERLFPMRSGARIRPPKGVISALSDLGYEFPAKRISDLLFETTGNSLMQSSGELAEFSEEPPRSFAKMPRFSTNDEQPLFFEPGAIYQPARYFRVTLAGDLLSKSPEKEDEPLIRQSRAVSTLKHFNLNAGQKVAARERVFSQRIERLFKADQSNIGELLRFGDMDFGGAWYLLLRRIGARWCARLTMEPRLSEAQITRTFEKLVATDTPDILDTVLKDLVREDEGRSESVSFKSTPLDVVQAPAERPRLYARPDARISSVKIRNFKALESIDIEMPDPPQPDENSSETPSAALLFLGENASEKSSILEAITLGCVSAETYANLDENHNKWILNPRYMGTPENAPIVEKSRRCEITIKLEDQTEYRTTFEPSGPAKRQTRQGVGKSWSAIQSEDAPLIFAYGAHRLFGKNSGNDGPLSNIGTLFDNGKLVTDPEQWLVELFQNDPAALDSIVARLRELISIDGEFTSIEVVPDPDDPDDPDKLCCEMHMTRKRSGGSTDEETDTYQVVMPLAAVSSGYRTIIALFCDVVAGLSRMYPDQKLNESLIQEILRTTCTVLIDEIEAHLHPRWKMQVISGLRSVLPNASFILTSHDPLCVRGMFEGEIFVLNRLATDDENGSEALLERVEFQPSRMVTDLFTVEQLLTSDLFNLLTTEGKRSEERLARLADAQTGGFLTDEATRELENEIAEALPIGNTEVIRLVQEAVREYLKERRAKGGRSGDARKAAIERIKQELERSVL